MTKQMITGNPAKQIVLFTIPLLIGNLFQQLYNVADTFIVGRTIGVHALAAVGSTASIIFLIFGFSMGMSTGISMITAQRFGAGDEEGVRRSVATSAWISLFTSILLSVIGVLLTRPILEFMQTPADIIDDAYSYLVVILGGIAALMLFNLLANAIRALGDSKTPLIFLAIACVLNIVLNYILILGFGMGVGAVAWGTLIAQLASSLMCIWYIKKKFPLLHLKKEDWKMTREDFISHARIGIPMGFQMSVISIGFVIMQFVLNGLGAFAVAAFTTAFRIEQLVVLPLMSFASTMGTYTAQNYGAGKLDRIKKGVFQCTVIAVSISVVGGVINILFGYQLTSLFIGGEMTEVLGMAQVYLRINGSFLWVLTLLMIFRSALQGLGNGGAPLVSGILELVARTFAAIFLAGVFGFIGVAWAGPLAWFWGAVPLMIMYFITMRKLTRESRL